MEKILQQILQELRDLRQGQGAQGQELKAQGQRLDQIEAELQEVKKDTAEISTELQEVKKDTREIKKELRYVWEDIKKIDNRLSTQEKTVENIKRLK